MAKLSLSDLHAIREREEKNLKKRDIHGRTVHVVVAMGTSGIEKGAKLVLNTIADEVEKRGLENVIITQSGAVEGRPEPVVEVFRPGEGLTIYGNVGKDDAVRIVAEHLEGGKAVDGLIVGNEE